MKKWIAFTVAAGAVLFLLISPIGAQGGEEEGGFTAQGSCSMGSVWGLTMSQEVGVSLEVHLETGVPDQAWHVILGYNHHVLVKTTEYTEDDGGFEFFKVENNAQGEDVGTVIATNLETGETCWGKLRVEI
jgi:hypothetical protein